MVSLGPFLAWLFIVAVFAVLILTMLAVIESTVERVFPKWHAARAKGPFSTFLRRNGAINGALSETALAALLILAILEPIIDKLNGWLTWSQAGPLVGRAIFLLFFLYIFLGIVSLLGERSTAEATPFIRRSANRLVAAFSPPANPDDEALLRYSYSTE